MPRAECMFGCCNDVLQRSDVWKVCDGDACAAHACCCSGIERKRAMGAASDVIAVGKSESDDRSGGVLHELCGK